MVKDQRIKFSLILATKGRVGEVRDCLSSLALQTYKNFEVVIIDQNESGMLEGVIEPFRRTLVIKHVRSSPGLSRARNVGMKEADGDIFAFPDDDCMYLPTTLEAAHKFFVKNPEYGGLTGRAVIPGSSVSAWNFDRISGDLKKLNIFERAVSFTIFLRRSVVEAVGSFNPMLGVGAGTKWGSGEETEYLLRALEAQVNIFYEYSFVVEHPAIANRCDKTTIKKAYRYGCGLGYVLGAHRFPMLAVIYRLSRPVAGSLLALGRLRGCLAAYYVMMLVGRAVGYRDGRMEAYRKMLLER